MDALPIRSGLIPSVRCRVCLRPQCGPPILVNTSYKGNINKDISDDHLGKFLLNCNEGKIGTVL